MLIQPQTSIIVIHIQHLKLITSTADVAPVTLLDITTNKQPTTPSDVLPANTPTLILPPQLTRETAVPERPHQKSSSPSLPYSDTGVWRGIYPAWWGHVESQGQGGPEGPDVWACPKKMVDEMTQTVDAPPSLPIEKPVIPVDWKPSVAEASVHAVGVQTEQRPEPQTLPHQRVHTTRKDAFSVPPVIPPSSDPERPQRPTTTAASRPPRQSPLPGPRTRVASTRTTTPRSNVRRDHHAMVTPPSPPRTPPPPPSHAPLQFTISPPRDGPRATLFEIASAFLKSDVMGRLDLKVLEDDDQEKNADDE
ncbi:hypothetical protein HKX48_000848 [Thoreauomyces humboldtii]|nr:hypothetical protein HKX48_000848 [Thoreauomyces humboldtii]